MLRSGATESGGRRVRGEAREGMRPSLIGRGSRGQSAE
ncbi:hypothetical protein FRUB_03663 [Fimbriiglobus ruber]|uniref:Uncharacterized protein n=1 Tax=Fimbriiglobus ruber TaxID=1908690 RepID=A0A225DZ13_9BACT|nr:hypothetical protein FRUB_03663 [Fimbriiglobus ruber]